MNDTAVKHSAAWINFVMANFVISAAMMAIGIFFLPLDLSTKGFLTMATLMIVQSAITATKTIRDNQEAGKLVNKIEDAKTEKLLMGIDTNKPA